MNTDLIRRMIEVLEKVHGLLTDLRKMLEQNPWTSTILETPGFYWLRNKKEGWDTIVNIFDVIPGIPLHQQDPSLQLIDGTVHSFKRFIKYQQSPLENSFEWSGPIERPGRVK